MLVPKIYQICSNMRDYHSFLTKIQCPARSQLRQTRRKQSRLEQQMASVDKMLIVGCGIAGLTLAAALHQQGFTVELVERSTVWRAEGGGIAVQPNGMRMLRALGLDAAVERAG